MLEDYGERSIITVRERERERRRMKIEDTSVAERKKDKGRKREGDEGLSNLSHSRARSAASSQEAMVMPAACREHTRSPQYENIIGRKPEGTQQCAELSSAAPALQRDLSLPRYSATSGCQDFR